jgi:serine/threonine protein kinase
MRYLHGKNVCHRDLKLENILLDKEKNLKIIDFGFATVSNKQKLKVFCGTPSYMAPEIVMKVEYYGAGTDIWSCGVILYVMIAGRFPFKSPLEKDLYRKIAKGVVDFPDFVNKED